MILFAMYHNQVRYYADKLLKGEKLGFVDADPTGLRVASAEGSEH
jgi:hypothetical protein